MRKLLVIISLFGAFPAFAEAPKSIEEQAYHNYICKDGFLTDPNTSEADRELFKKHQDQLKKFCKAGRFQCIDSRGLFGRTNGVCDTDNLCKEDYLKAACQVVCVDKAQPGIPSTSIKYKLDACEQITEASKSPVKAPVIFDEIPGLQSQGPASLPVESPVSVPQSPVVDSQTAILAEPTEIPAVTNPDVAPPLPQLDPELNQDRAPVNNTPSADNLNTNEFTPPIAPNAEPALPQLDADFNQEIGEANNIPSTDTLSPREVPADLNQSIPQTDNFLTQNSPIPSQEPAPSSDDSLGWNE